MEEKRKYDRLSPADQIAIDNMLTKAKKEDLEYAYKEVESVKALKKKPLSCGEVLLIIIMVVFFITVAFIITAQIETTTTAARNGGSYACEHFNSTYLYSYSGTFSFRVHCRDGTVIDLSK